MTRPLPGANRGEGLGGWFRRAIQRMIEAREREAQRRAAIYVRDFDDETIEHLGMDRGVVTALRREQTHHL
ncbi:MAG: hypothetical protein ACR2PO_10415 [Methyloligellaceae bacterium]